MILAALDRSQQSLSLSQRFVFPIAHFQDLFYFTLVPLQDRGAVRKAAIIESTASAAVKKRRCSNDFYHCNWSRWEVIDSSIKYITLQAWSDGAK